MRADPGYQFVPRSVSGGSGWGRWRAWVRGGYRSRLWRVRSHCQSSRRTYRSRPGAQRTGAKPRSRLDPAAADGVRLPCLLPAAR